MRLENRSLGFLINFLLGVAWAAAMIGAVTSFLAYYQQDLFFALVSMLIGTLPGLVGVLLLEYIITAKETASELSRQTELLQALLEQTQQHHDQ